MPMCSIVKTGIKERFIDLNFASTVQYVAFFWITRAIFWIESMVVAAGLCEQLIREHFHMAVNVRKI